MAARLPSGRVVRDWWQRRPPKDEPRREVFLLRRSHWLLHHRWFNGLYGVIYESEMRPRRLSPAALHELQALRRSLDTVADIIDRVIEAN